MSWRLYQAKAEPVPTTPEAVSEDKWNYSFSDPVRLKPGLPAYLQHSLEFDPIPVETLVTGLMPWFGWLSSPSAMAKKGLGAPYQQAVIEPPFSYISAIANYSWRPPFGEPVRQKLGARAETQQFLAFTEAAPFAEQTYYSKYAYPWSDPVRLKVGLGAHLQQFFAYEPDPINLILIKDIPWYNWLSNPSVMTKPRLNTGSQPVSTISPYIPTFVPLNKGYVIE